MSRPQIKSQFQEGDEGLLRFEVSFDEIVAAVAEALRQQGLNISEYDASTIIVDFAQSEDPSVVRDSIESVLPKLIYPPA